MRMSATRWNTREASCMMNLRIRNQVRRLTSRIYGQVKEQYQPPEGEDKDEMLAMNQETWRRYPPDQNWLSDLIQTLLVDEMFRRRSAGEIPAGGHKKNNLRHEK